MSYTFDMVNDEGLSNLTPIYANLEAHTLWFGLSAARRGAKEIFAAPQLHTSQFCFFWSSSNHTKLCIKCCSLMLQLASPHQNGPF